MVPDDELRHQIDAVNSTTPSIYPPRPSRSLLGRVAIVTGAGSRSAGIGNGRAAAILLAEAGALVVCSDVNLSFAEETVDMILKEFGRDWTTTPLASESPGPKAIPLQADVSREADCKRTVEITLATFGRLDILVNNVGIVGPSGTAVELELEAWRRGLEVNVTSMVLMTKYAVPAMERNSLGKHSDLFGRGSIVNIASVMGLVGGTPGLLYPTSKGAVVNMTRAMAVQHAPQRIRVNVVCPGLLYTPMTSGGSGADAKVRTARQYAGPLRTEGNGWDCGAAVRFLASEEARWITGTVLTVDAGLTSSVYRPDLNLFGCLS